MQTQTLQVCNTIASRLVFARDQKGFDLETVARSAEITPELLARYESGVIEPFRSMVMRLSLALECDFGWLIGEPGAVIGEDGLFCAVWFENIEPLMKNQLFDIFDLSPSGLVPSECFESLQWHEMLLNERERLGFGYDVKEFVFRVTDEWRALQKKGGVSDAAQSAC